MNLCILCQCGVPNGQVFSMLRKHHITPRSLGGPDDETNLAWTDLYHHMTFDHYPTIWMKAKVHMGVSAEFYRDSHWWVEGDYPPFAECLGKYGYGDEFFREGIPRTLQMVYGGKIAEGLSFCKDLCTQRVLCEHKKE